MPAKKAENMSGNFNAEERAAMKDASRRSHRITSSAIPRVSLRCGYLGH
jgi:hypothetical protein